MKNKQNLIIVFILLSIWFRLVPHPPNFTPVASLALFSGVMLNRKWLSLIVPLIAMILSDIILGFSSITIWVYLGFGLITISGWLFKEMKAKSVIMSSIIFFIVSNFGVWWLSYPHTIDGLLICYTLAIPFLGYSLLGDIFWSSVLVTSYSYIEKKVLSFVSN